MFALQSMYAFMYFFIQNILKVLLRYSFDLNDSMKLPIDFPSFNLSDIRMYTTVVFPY